MRCPTCEVNLMREVVLLPIAVLARNPSRPMHELLIAAAGPAVNVVIIAVLAVVMGVKALATGNDAAALVAAAQGPPSVAAAVSWLLGMNVALVLFNLIPAFPLDGGRILRGLLGFVTGWARATRIATVTGQAVAVAMGLGGLVTGNIVLVLIAVFVFLGAGATRADEQARSSLSTRRVGDAYNRHALSLSEHDRASKVVDYILTSYQPDFAVMRGRQFIGAVLREDLIEHLANGRGDVPVVDLMTPSVLGVAADESLDAVRSRLLDADARVAAVYDRHGAFLSLVSHADIAEACVLLHFIRDPAAEPDGDTKRPAWDGARPVGPTTEVAA